MMPAKRLTAEGFQKSGRADQPLSSPWGRGRKKIEKKMPLGPNIRKGVMLKEKSPTFQAQQGRGTRIRVLSEGAKGVLQKMTLAVKRGGGSRKSNGKGDQNPSRNRSEKTLRAPEGVRSLLLLGCTLPGGGSVIDKTDLNDSQNGLLSDRPRKTNQIERCP